MDEQPNQTDRPMQHRRTIQRLKIQLQRLRRQLTKRQDLPLLLLRVGVGVIFVSHGTMKLADPVGTTEQFAGLGIPLPWMAMLLAIAGEFAGGLGLILGALTRLAALGPLFTMLVAIATVHLGHGIFAVNGGWEYPLTLLLVSLLFVIRGGGRYSVDAWIERVRSTGGGRPAVHAHAHA